MRYAVAALPFAALLVHCVGDEPSAPAPPDADGGPATTDSGVTETDAGTTGTAQLALTKTKSWIHQGETVDVGFTVTRTGATGPLSVRAAKLPAGVTAADVMVDATGKGTVSFVAASAAPPGISADVDVELVDGASVADRKTVTLRTAGAPGDLDTTWGTAGIRTLTIRNPAGGATFGSSYAVAIAIVPAPLPDAGKIVVAGRVYSDDAATNAASMRPFVARFNADGTVDTTFGEPSASGKSGYRILDRNVYPATIALDSLGRIVLATHGDPEDPSGQSVGAFRFTADGELDTTFTTFFANLPGGGYSGVLTSVVSLPNDKIMLGAYWNRYTGPGAVDCTDGACGTHPILGQLDATGARDGTFATNGVKTLAEVDGAKTVTYLSGMKRDAQGRLVFVGAACTSTVTATPAGCKSLVARVTAAGDYDATFGTSGAAQVSFGATNGIEKFDAVAFDANGDIVAVGANQGYTRAIIARVKGADGTLDTSFATGSQAVDLGGTSQIFTTVAVDSTGRIVAFGNANDGATTVQRVRFGADGTRDTTYGPTKIHIPGVNPWGTLTADDQAVVAFGTYRAGSTAPYDIAVARLWP